MPPHTTSDSGELPQALHTSYRAVDVMEGAFTHVGNHLVSNSASAINAGDDESILDGNLVGGRGLAPGARRRRNDDDDETDVFDDDDMESMAGLAVDGANGKAPLKVEEEVELPPHACAYVHHSGDSSRNR